MTTPPFLTSELLAQSSLPGGARIRHGFFSRLGGVSSGDYASLNVGLGSDDNPSLVLENKNRCRQALSPSPSSGRSKLITLRQVHSADVVTLTSPFSGQPPQADGMVTNRPGLMLGVLAADCMPWLFVDPQAGVIGAAHAGWRGALAGVLEQTVKAMVKIGAHAPNISAALGPCLRQPNFEVGLDLKSAFNEKYEGTDRFFIAGKAEDKRQLDLAGFAKWRLEQSGVARIDDVGVCTLGAPDHYFSYRHSRQTNQEDYGRNLSAIVLA